MARHPTPLILGVVLVGASACTDLGLTGEPQLSCVDNGDCPEGTLCAAVVGRCLDEAVVLEPPIGVAADAVVDNARIGRAEGFAVAAVTVGFTKAPVTVEGTVDQRVAIPCEADDSGPEVVRCAFDARAFPDEADGLYEIVVTGTDAAGNVARSRATFTLDTTPPALAPASVVIRIDNVDSPLREVTALGPHTVATVQLTLTELPATPPTLSLVDDDGEHPLRLDEARSSGLLFAFTTAGMSLPADGRRPLTLRVADDVDNQATIDDVGEIVVDAVAPAAAVVETAGAVVYRRQPWGSGDDPTPRFEVVGSAGSVEAGATVLVTAAATVDSSLLGIGVASDDGGVVVGLNAIDLPRVFVHVVDGAGNVATAARVRDVRWTASFGGRVRGDPFSNPHALFSTTDFDDAGLDVNLADEVARAGQLVGGAGLIVDAAAVPREVRSEASGQPVRMGASLGYLPRLETGVLFGGAAVRFGVALPDTFLLRDGRWTAFVGDRPRAAGRLVYDTRAEVLVTHLADGSTWTFDGQRWRELPIDPPAPVSQAPLLAWDPEAERLVRVAAQERETWVLEGETWRQLPESAPEALFGVGFDGVDGHVVGFSATPAGGTVWALVDDAWQQVGAGHGLFGGTVVEGGDGRVGVVCGLGEAARDAAVVRWTGAGIGRGPVDVRPRLDCGAAVDPADGTLLLVGGAEADFANPANTPTNAVTALGPDAAAFVEIAAGTPPTPRNRGHASTVFFDPIRDRQVIFGGDLGIAIVIDGDLWDGARTSPIEGSVITAPFFDGVSSRALGPDVFLEGENPARWVSRGPDLGVPFGFTATWHEGLDVALLFGGLQNGVLDTTRTLRGSTLTTLSPTTSPPGRFAATSAYDDDADRVIMVGGLSGATTLSDTWAFEDGDWRQLGDMPQRDLQRKLAWDRRRGVMMLFVGGSLYELRDDVWVAAPVGEAPRRDSLAFYDENAGLMTFVGGLDFEAAVQRMFRLDIAGARSAVIADFDLGARGAAADATLTDMRLVARTGADGADGTVAAPTTLQGVDILVWGQTGFVPVGATVGSTTAPSGATLSLAEIASAGSRRRLVVALRSPPTGPGRADGAGARLVTSQLELVVDYREP